MAGKIVKPTTRKIYKTLIKEVVADLHKPIKAHLPPLKQDCPNCQWDNMARKSSGTHNASFVAPTLVFGQTINPAPFTRGRCPVCKDIGYLTSPVTRSLKAMVKWNVIGAKDIEATPAGLEGSPYVRIKVLRADFAVIDAAESFTVDGIHCVKARAPTIRGLGVQEELVVMYLVSTDPGSDVKR